MGQLDWALYLVRTYGFRVFPCGAYSKKPKIDQFQHYASNNEEVIKTWWTNPSTGILHNWNIGVLTTGMVVLDTDVKRGINGNLTYLKECGVYDTFTVSTPSGGQHFYFQGPDSKQTVNLFPGIDIRSHNGYVLGPGSVLPNGNYELLCGKPPAYIPIPIWCLLKTPNRPREQEVTNIEYDKEVNIANAEVWLKEQPPAISGQGGNNRTYIVAATLVRDFALTPETTYSLLLESYNPRCIPPWSPEELTGFAEHARDYAVGPVGARLPEATFSTVKVIPTPPADAPAPGNGIPTNGPPGREQDIYPGNFIDLANLPPRPWIVTDLLLRRAITNLTGTGGIGKSMLILCIAAHLAVGLPYGPFIPKDNKPIYSLIYDKEEDRGEQTRRMIGICRCFNISFDEVKKYVTLISKDEIKFVFSMLDRGSVVSVEDHKEFLISMAKKVNADIIFLNPFASLHRLNMNDAAHMTSFLDTVDEIAQRTNTSLVLASHTSKKFKSDSPGDIDATAGSAANTNGVRIALTLMPLQGQDLLKYQIPEEDIRRFVRLDVSKGNNTNRAGSLLGFFEFQGIKTSNDSGDDVGVLVPYIGVEESRLAEVIALILSQNTSASLSLPDLIKEIGIRYPTLAEKSDLTIRRGINEIFKHGNEATLKNGRKLYRQIPQGGRGIRTIVSLGEQRWT